MAVDDMELEGGKKKKGAGKLIFIIILVVVLLGGAAVGLRIFAPGLIPGWGEKGQAASGQSNGGEPAVRELISMAPFIVNLADATGRRYLKLTLSLEMDSPELKKEIQMKDPQIRDAILILLSSKYYDDINTVEGKMALRANIIEDTNRLLTTGQVTNAYFVEFVVQ